MKYEIKESESVPFITRVYRVEGIRSEWVATFAKKEDAEVFVTGKERDNDR